MNCFSVVLFSDLLKAIEVRTVPKLQKALEAVKRSSRDMQYKLELETARAERSELITILQ